MCFPVIAFAALATGCCLDVCRFGGDETPRFLGSQVPQPTAGPGQLEVDTPTEICEADYLDYAALSPEAIETGQVEYWDLTLQQAVQLCLTQSSVMRDLGGTILRAPENVTTVQDPALTFTDPRVGEEAALSLFDATVDVTALLQENDRVFNNAAIGTGGFLRQDLGNFNMQIAKRAATGTQMAFRQITDYEQSNNIANTFGNPSSSWTSILESEVRQPLLQGAGIRFNRTAGPSQQPGVLNGVLLARIRSDVSVADFEVAVRDLVTNVENAYWDLYFAYRDLDAKKKARNDALDAWVRAKERTASGLSGNDEVYQAEEQYWRFESDVSDAVTGRLFDSTRTNNGSSGGTFRGSPGVRVAERRLRLAMGLPITDTRLLRPADEPPAAPVRFDWDSLASQAVDQRPELRRQRWRIKQRELELLANRNFLLPRLDAVGRYRVRGFGEVLMSESEQPFRSSVDNLFDGDFQEWELGMELSVPLGFRRAHSAVRNSELALAREQAILEEQKRTIMFGLSNAVGDVHRAYQVAERQYNRLLAAQEQQRTMLGLLERNEAAWDLVLEAQRRVVDAEISFHRAQSEYAVALKNVQYEKGTLLEYYNVFLTEGASSNAAYAAAAERRRRQVDVLDYTLHDAIIGSPATSGETPQGIIYRTVAPDDAARQPAPQDDSTGTLPTEIDPTRESATDKLPTIPDTDPPTGPIPSQSPAAESPSDNAAEDNAAEEISPPTSPFLEPSPLAPAPAYNDASNISLTSAAAAPVQPATTWSDR